MALCSTIEHEGKYRNKYLREKFGSSRIRRFICTGLGRQRCHSSSRYLTSSLCDLVDSVDRRPIRATSLYNEYHYCDACSRLEPISRNMIQSHRLILVMHHAKLITRENICSRNAYRLKRKHYIYH